MEVVPRDLDRPGAGCCVSHVDTLLDISNQRPPSSLQIPMLQGGPFAGPAKGATGGENAAPAPKAPPGTILPQLSPLSFRDEDASSATCRSTACSQDELALEVGLNAHDYLEECFYTEVSILDRNKFDAIPEIDKSDLTILGHLGKGNFSDVFEVVCKDNQLRDAEAGKAAPGRRRPSWGRSRRATLSSSITTATLAKPTVCGETQLHFALKCLRPQIRSDADQFIIGAEDLVHETAILANLNHPHIIKLHGRASGHLRDAFLLNDGYFILLDRLEETLPDRIARWKENPECVVQGPTGEQMEVARSVADAMSYLHSKSVIFRDLKPANVGFDPSGVLKLFDFGFATGLPEPDEADNPSGFLFDRCGTPRYMAPEVGLSLGYSLPSDVYSFGILLWEICSLAKPFASIRTSADFDRRVFIGGERPTMVGSWPATVRAIMASCWRAAPGKRPAMPAVESVLAAAMGDGHSGGRAPKKVGRPSMARRRTDDGRW